MVERELPKLEVAGSTPVVRFWPASAAVAELAAFLVGEPVLIESGSDGAVAAETYRITAAIAVMTMLEVGMMAMLKV